MKKAEVQAKGLVSNSSSDITHQLKITELSNPGHLTTHVHTHAHACTHARTQKQQCDDGSQL